MNPEAELPPDEDFQLKQIRTFQGDMAEALKHKDESVVSLSRRERERKEEYERQKQAQTQADQELQERQSKLVEEAQIREFPQEETLPIPAAPKPAPAPVPMPLPPVRAPYVADEAVQTESHFGRTLMLVLGTIILLGLGGAGGWYAYTQYQTKTALPTINVPANQFVTPQSIFDVNTATLTRETLINTIRTERGSNVPTGSIHQVDLREGGSASDLVTTEHFFVRYLESQAPSSLIRSFDPLFMLGILGKSPGEAAGHTFVIIKLDSFENAFPGMLAWEQTIAKDLLPLFASDSTIASLASTTIFSDITIQNKDARVLKDIGGKTVMLYSFYDNNYLILTDNELSLRQLISALNAKRLVR